MSLFRPDLWFPGAIDYPVQLLVRPLFLADYIAATLISTLFLGVQLVALGYILRQYLLQYRLRKASWSQRQSGAAFNPWCYISLALAILYTASVVLAWVAFGQRYTSITQLSAFERTEEETLKWFRDNPDHEGVKMICIPAGVGPGRETFCRTFKLTKNLLSYMGVETAYAAIVEVVILMVDGILIYRFYTIFSMAKLVYPVVILLSMFSLAGPLMGIVSLAKLASLGAKSDPWWPANFPANSFLAWHSPWLAVVMPVLVNVIVTVAIITRILTARRRIQKLVGRMPSDNVYLGLTAALIESALPSAVFGVLAAVFGVLAAVFQRAGKGDVERIKFSPTTLWVAFTALSPQFIIIRVLQGRAWSKEVALSAWSSSDMPLIFAREHTQDATAEESSHSEHTRTAPSAASA